MRVRLVRLSSTHNKLRTDKIEGECLELPEVGRSFIMTAPPLDPKAQQREIWTTPVQSVGWLPSRTKAVFQTKNSRYRLEMMD